eukprot:5921192-Prymnesium_polylepis.1
MLQGATQDAVAGGEMAAAAAGPKSPAMLGLQMTAPDDSADDSAGGAMRHTTALTWRYAPHHAARGCLRTPQHTVNATNRFDEPFDGFSSN